MNTSTVTVKQAVLSVLALAGAANSDSKAVSIYIAEKALPDEVIALGYTDQGYRRDAMLRSLRDIIATDPSWLEYIEGPEVHIPTPIWKMFTGEMQSI